jgi:HPt (histidine-containing phosphotransfer) domain-containing protein
MHSLHEALKSADSARLKRVAHTLKGNAALFGASPMVNAAGQLETLSSDLGNPLIPALLQQLEQAFPALQSALRQRRSAG